MSLITDNGDSMVDTQACSHENLKPITSLVHEMYK